MKDQMNEHMVKASLIVGGVLDECHQAAVDPLAVALVMFEHSIDTIAINGGSQILERVLTNALCKVVDRAKKN